MEWPRHPLPWTHHRGDRSARPGALRAATTRGRSSPGRGGRSFPSPSVPASTTGASEFGARTPPTPPTSAGTAQAMRCRLGYKAIERIFGAGFSENLSRRADRPVLVVSEPGLQRSSVPRTTDATSRPTRSGQRRALCRDRRPPSLAFPPDSGTPRCSPEQLLHPPHPIVQKLEAPEPLPLEQCLAPLPR